MAWRVLSCIRRSDARFLIARTLTHPDLLCSLSNISLSVSSCSKQLHSQMSKLRHSNLTGSIFDRYGFSSSASRQASEETDQFEKHDNTSKTCETSQKTSGDEGASITSDAVGDSTAPANSTFAGLNSKSEQVESQSLRKRRRRVTRTAFSDSDAEPELSVVELAKLVAEKDDILKLKKKEIENMQEKVFRAYAEMENVLERTKREIENSKKYGIQNFAKSLLDVADNLGRASNVVMENFSKIDQTSDTVGLGLLKSLLAGVEMTDKQLAEVFRKSGIEKYDPLNETFDPNRHNAVFEIPDASKPPGTVAAVLKVGYMLYDRVIRPAEVGVIKSLNSDENQNP